MRSRTGSICVAHGLKILGLLILVNLLGTGCDGTVSVEGRVYRASQGSVGRVHTNGATANRQNRLKPVEKAKVTIYCGGEFDEAVAYTDPTGRFSLTAVTSPRERVNVLLLIVEKDGFRTVYDKVRRVTESGFGPVDVTLSGLTDQPSEPNVE